MDLSKSYEFLQPEKVRERIHLIGCGSVGSTLAELLARAGFTKITLYDFDTVEAHNIANQMFVQSDINTPKVEAVAKRLKEINPLIETDLMIEPNGWTGQKLSGFVFLAVDNIDLRRKIVQENMGNPFIKAMFDFRTRLTDAQHYAADWSDMKHKRAFLGTMDFTHEEAQAETPMSACHVELSMAATVWSVCIAGITNFINFVQKKYQSDGDFEEGDDLKKVVLVNPFRHTTDAI